MLRNDLSNITTQMKLLLEILDLEIKIEKLNQELNELKKESLN